MDVILRNLPFLLKGTFPDGPLGGLALTLCFAVVVGFACLCIGFLFATATLAPYRAGILVNNRELICSLQIFGFLGLVYFCICYLLSLCGKYLERRWSWAPSIGTLHVAV